MSGFSISGRRDLYRGKWLVMNEITWRGPTGKENHWEAVSRATRQPGSGLDAVVVIATLKSSDSSSGDRLILAKEFRPPAGGFVLGFPAGLVEAGESPADAARREMLEETGYTVRVRHYSSPVHVDAGLGSTTISMVTADVDQSDPRNSAPKQRLDEGEFIEVVLLPVKDLCRQLEDLLQSGSVFVENKLYTYALAQETFHSSS